ncbi:MAG TPA: lysoplasmalogenase [Spirochaetota bacterium]|mgnify:CR=1 FL=1|nr:lysoplasmalogenase [Spirochaetota bacterium]
MTLHLFGSASLFFVAVFMIREFVALRRIRKLKYLFTPLVTIAVIFIPMIAIGEAGLTPYNSFITCALLLALSGDTLLMVEETDLLKPGMLFFLGCHVLYAAAFAVKYSFRQWNIILLVVLALTAVFHVKRLSRTAGKMTIPVAVYVTAITVMIFLAIAQLNNGFTEGAVMAAVGAVLFGISDYVHSVNNFVRKIENSTVYTWLFYAPAQFLIAASTLSVF